MDKHLKNRLMNNATNNGEWWVDAQSWQLSKDLHSICQTPTSLFFSLSLVGERRGEVGRGGYFI